MVSDTLISKLMKYYVGYDKEDVLVELDNLIPKNKEIMELRFGLNGSPVTKIDDIAERFSLTSDQIYGVISSSKAKIKKSLQENVKLEKKNTYAGKKTKFNDKLKKDFPGNSKEEILEAANTLSPKSKQTFILSYGLDGSAPLSNKEISEKLSANVKSVSQNLYLARVKVRSTLNKMSTKQVEVKNDEDKDETKALIISDGKKIRKVQDGELYENALYYFRKKDYDEVEKICEQLLKITNNNTYRYKANFYLGEIYRNKSRFLLAEEYYKEALEYREEYHVLCGFGKTLLKLKKYDEALSCFEKCDTFNFKKHVIEKAKTLHYLGRTTEALKLLDSYISLYNKSYKAHLMKARIFFEQKNYEYSMEEIKKCEAINPKFDSHKIIEGKIKYFNGNKKEALTIFDKCINNESNPIPTIKEIGYFFHKINEKEFALKYYSMDSTFSELYNLTESEITEHFEKHKKNSEDKKIHSIFNVDLSMNELQQFVNNMDVTYKMQFYDIYQIKFSNVGYTVTNDEKIMQDYLTIYTLPFSKKVMMCYPYFKLRGELINEPVQIDELRKKIGQTSNVDKRPMYKDDSHMPKKETILSNEFDMPAINDFNENKENFRMLINLLSNPKEQVVLLLRLGYVDGKCYPKEELSKFLNISVEEVNNIINNALSNISSLSMLTINSVESVRKILKIN